MGFRRTYLLCNLGEASPLPSDGPLWLGSILCSLQDPYYVLNKHDIHPIPNYNPPVDWRDYHHFSSTSSDYSLRLCARFLSLFEIGPSVHATYGNNAVHDIKINKLTTHTFEPTDDYIKAAINSCRQAQHYVESGRSSVSLYLVTGLKIAYGSEIHLDENKVRGISASIGVGAGVDPILSIGPEGSCTKKSNEGISFVHEEPFVLAFRVHKINVRKDMSVKKSQEFAEGACLSMEDDEPGSGFTVSSVTEMNFQDREGVVLGSEEDDGDLFAFVVDDHLV